MNPCTGAPSEVGINSPALRSPARRPIPIQLWDIQRAEITAGLLVALAVAVALFGAYLSVVGLL